MVRRIANSIADMTAHNVDSIVVETFDNLIAHTMVHMTANSIAKILVHIRIPKQIR